MVLYLEGVVAQVTISKLTAGTYFSISMVTGVAAALGMLIALPVSGGHLNPAVTLSFVLFRRFPVQKAPGFIIGQVILLRRQFLPLQMADFISFWVVSLGLPWCMPITGAVLMHSKGITFVPIRQP